MRHLHFIELPESSETGRTPKTPKTQIRVCKGGNPRTSVGSISQPALPWILPSPLRVQTLPWVIDLFLLLDIVA